MTEMITIKQLAKETNIGYAKLLHHVNKGFFPEAVLEHGTRWKIPKTYIEKFLNNEINLSTITRGNKSESTLEKEIVKHTKKQGHNIIKIQGVGNKYWPDRLILLNNGSCFFLEVKKEGEQPSKGQKNKHQRIKDLNHRVYTVSNIESYKRLLRKVCK